MRRVVLNLLLAALFVLAQQAALLHQIGHGVGGQAYASSQGTGSAGGHPVDGSASCDKCFQFAHVTSALPEAAFVAMLLAADQESARSEAPAELAGEAPPVRSRGPPSLL
jgi:hypothetical protein